MERRFVGFTLRSIYGDHEPRAGNGGSGGDRGREVEAHESSPGLAAVGGAVEQMGACTVRREQCASIDQGGVGVGS